MRPPYLGVCLRTITSDMKLAVYFQTKLVHFKDKENLATRYDYNLEFLSLTSTCQSAMNFDFAHGSSSN